MTESNENNNSTGSFSFPPPKPETIERTENPYPFSDKIPTKRWNLTVDVQRYVQLLTRLMYDQLTRKQLAMGMLDLYLSDDEDMIKVINKIKDRFQHKRKYFRKTRHMIEADKRKSLQLQEEFEIVEKDNSELYSIREKELPESFLDESELQEIEKKKKEIKEKKSVIEENNERREKKWKEENK